MTAQKAMNAMKTVMIGRRLCIVGLAALLLSAAAHPGLAQNDAQRAALARLRSARAAIHAQDAATSGTEATSLGLALPSAVAFDATGDLFLADTANHRILEVNLSGLVTSVAGTGEQGFGGDGGAATSALLDSPMGIAVDANGNIYIADTHNNRIREVVAGTIGTIAGTGAAGFSGDGGAATAATLNLPTAIAVDSNASVYIADTNNHRIREITGTTINTVAGNGNQSYSGDGGLATAAGLDSPNGVAVDSAFNIYIGDTHNQRIRMVTYATGIIATLAGTSVKGFTADGAAGAAALARPSGLAVDSSGTVYFADSDNQRIRSVAGGQVTTIAGNGEEGYSGDTGIATSASLDTPRAVALRNGALAVADTQNHLVREVTNNGIDTVAGSQSGNRESLSIGGVASIAYGTGTLTATFSNGSNTATGHLTLYDGLGAGPAMVGTAALAANSATFNTSQLAAGLHYLIASFPGDANNAPITSGVFVLAVTPVAVTGVANAVSLLYGQTIPALTGTLNGVLAQDAGKVSASYSTTATATSAPGSYPIAIALTGPAANNYVLTVGASSGAVVISQAPQAITFTPLASPIVYVAPIALTATGGASGNPVTFSIVSGPGSVSGNLLTITGVGTVVVAANQAGNSNYAAAAQVTQSVVSVASTLNFNATSLAFGSVPLGSTSPAQTLIIANPNGVAMTSTSIVASGDFAAISNCPAIAALSTCSVNITFTPTASGARTGTVTVTDAQASSSQTISLTGTGTAPGIQITPAVLNFGSQVIATASYGQTIAIQNTGTANLVISNIAATGDFTTTGNCATVPAGSDCSLTVTFTPTATGTRTGTVTLTDNAGSGSQSQVINLTGVGTQAGATLTPSVQTFASTLVGSSSFALNAMLTNTGTAPLTGIGVSILGDFTQTNTCGSTLAPAAACTVSVTYAPTVAGAESGTLTVTSNLGPQSVSLMGTGLAPGASLSTAQLVFGGQLVNTASTAQTVVFTNTGSGAVSITSVTPSANFTDTTNCTGSIAQGSSCSINVVFAPAATGPLSGTLTIADSAGTQVATLQGRGVSKGLAVSPSFVIFGAQVVGATSQAQTLTVTNTGTAALTLNPIAVSNNFIESDQCSSIALQAGASCSISLSFAPTAIGTLQGSLVVGDTGGSVSTMATASGQGTLPGIAALPSTLSFGSLAVGTASQGQTVTVSNTGTASLQIGTVSGTGDFAETDTCSGRTIAAGSYCVISVTMTPTTLGMRTGSIQFADNADGLHVIALSGMGQQAGVSVSPTSLAFGSLPVVSASQVSTATGTSLGVTIANTGNMALQLGGFAAQGDFTQSNSCGATVAVGASCTVTVKFVPTALGHRTGTLTITDNAGGGTQLISLQGDGSPAGLVLTPPMLNFGVQSLGVASKPQTATLTNNTGKSITALAIAASGEYTESDNCGTVLANGASCTLTVTVTPVIAGAITGTITVSAGGAIVTGSQLRLRNEDANNSPSITVGVVAVSAITNGNQGKPVGQLAFGSSPAPTVAAGGNAGSAITVLENDSTGTLVNATDAITLTVTGPGSYSKSYTATASGGVATFNLSSSTLTAAGSYTYAAAVASSASIGAASASETVNTAAAASVTATAGSGQSAVIVAAFATPLQVTVKDAYGNPAAGAAVTFSAPASGASATLSSVAATTTSAGTASVTATANGSAGSYTVTAAVSGATSASFALTNARAASAVNVTASSNQSLLQSAVTFTATVSSTTAGTLTGTVTFLDGTTPLGSSPLSAGTASFTTSSLATGSHSITAAYSGDANFVGSGSGTLAQTIIDFAVSASTSGSGASQTVTPGGLATFTFGIAPTSGATLPAAATLTVTGLPAGATATLTPSTWTQLSSTSWQLPANTTLANFSLAFSVPSQTARLNQTGLPARKLPPMLWGILLLPLAAKLRRAARKLSRTISVLLLLAAGVAAITGLSGCGSSNGFFSQQQKAYNVTVTVTAGTLSHATNVTLTVQ